MSFSNITIVEVPFRFRMVSSYCEFLCKQQQMCDFSPNFFTVSCCIIINRLPEIACLTPFSQTVCRHDMIAVILNTTTVSCSHQRNHFKRLKVHTTWSQWFWSCCRSKSYYSSRIIFYCRYYWNVCKEGMSPQPVATMLKAQTIKQEMGDSNVFL